MSTHGVFILKLDDNIIGFHMCGDGGNVMSMFKLYKHIKNPIELLQKALEFFCDEGYSDRPSLNVYYEKYDPEEDYSNQTSFTLYFDGKKWLSKGKILKK